jgi:hypothetical protein
MLKFIGDFEQLKDYGFFNYDDMYQIDEFENASEKVWCIETELQDDGSPFGTLTFMINDRDNKDGRLRWFVEIESVEYCNDAQGYIPYILYDLIKDGLVEKL